MKKQSKTFKNIQNKKASHDYEFIDVHEAGMKLTSSDVKDIISGRFSIIGNYVRVVSGEIFLVGDSSQSSVKLLLHKKEITKLIGSVKSTGLTMIPIEVQQVRGKFKLKFALAKGKKEYDKRADDKNRDIDIDVRRVVKSQKFGDN